MKRLLALMMAILMVCMVSACSDNGNKTSSKSAESSGGADTSEGADTSSTGGNSEASGEVAELDFMFWGGAEEKAAVEQIVEKFNTEYDGKIHVTPQHVPDEYAQKLSSMIAAGDAPDIAYVPSGSFVPYAMYGIILFV